MRTTRLGPHNCGEDICYSFPLRWVRSNCESGKYQVSEAGTRVDFVLSRDGGVGRALPLQIFPIQIFRDL
jgi:hypothetical protein